MVTDRFPLRIPADRLPLLVTGISGVAGFNLFAFLRRRYGDLVAGIRPLETRRLAGPGIAGHALEDGAATGRLIRDGGFRSVLSTGGSCDLRGCELDPAMARRVNIGTVHSLVSAVAGTGIRLVHLSIDLVFGGTRGGRHVESDRPDPVTVYGQTMAEAEALIAERMPRACIGRISLPMGVSFNGHAGAIDWIRSRFEAGRPATLYFDEVRTPTYVECLAEVCEDLLANELAGLWHLGGPRPLTLNQIAQIVNVAGGYDPGLLRGCNRIEAGPIPPRAGNVTLDSSRLARALGREPFTPWPQDQRLVPDSREWHFKRDFRGSPEWIGKTLYCRGEPGTGG
jgi:dTDP-4-dehydrorhamnose reductase